MDKGIKAEFERVWKSINQLKSQLNITRDSDINGASQAIEDFFKFKDKSSDHATLLKELLKSEYCHNNGGLTRDEILSIFEKNKRPIVPKKISDLLNKWVERKKIEMIKKYGGSRYFWIAQDE